MYIYVCIWQCIYMYIYDKKWQPDYSNFLFLSHRVPWKFCWRSTRVVEPAVKEHFLVEFPPWMHICRGEIHFHVHLRLHWQGLHPTPGEVIWEVSCNYIASNRGWGTVWLILPICKHICKTPFRDTHYLLKWKFAKIFEDPHLLIWRKSPLLVFGPDGPRAKLLVRQMPSMDGLSPGSACEA